ncbi:MAG: histidine kinase [Candidatus Cohnella colombiensis]|uniref:histidine kinase n=1 Tax=Candidatus Cohnella colombiensis TaxID=3121368 RepID=A0AA95JGN9_9BACL|nr:MAG: histidine kinase [Cohnella sp.]
MSLNNQRIKWLILIIPTLTIGLWEYVRHAFLLPYISMDLGNFLAPFIVLTVTLTLVRSLFIKLEHSHEALELEKSTSAALEERESLARELHDGISQSLFLLAVKLDQLDGLTEEGPVRQLSEGLRETVRVMNDDVRQAIANLRLPPSPEAAAWVVPLRELLGETAAVTEAKAQFTWTISDKSLTDKEKVELHACLREVLMNVRKHAKASHVYVIGESDDQGGFRCAVEDNGIGFTGNPLQSPGRFGLRMVKDRATRMGWSFSIERKGDRTVVEWIKQGGQAQ